MDSEARLNVRGFFFKRRGSSSHERHDTLLLFLSMESLGERLLGEYISLFLNHHVTWWLGPIDSS